MFSGIYRLCRLWGMRNQLGLEVGGNVVRSIADTAGGASGESLEGEGTNHFPKRPTITCRKQWCIKGYRKSDRGRPEEINQTEVGFMPCGFRTNQADPF